MSVGDDDHTGGGEGHGPQARNRGEASQALSCPGVISSITLRVNYSETDQMGVVYHANYLIWFDRARTELMRETGLPYKELERQGVYLAVSEVNIRYRAPARYDDLVQVKCWVRDLGSRRVTFGYAVEFDGPLFREALAYPEAVVRRQGALALGRIGDPAAVDLLVAALSDSEAAVRAAAAFALGLVKDARAVEPLLALVRAVPPAEQGPPQAEAVTALAKIGGDAGARALRLLLGSGTSPGVPTSLAQTSALLEAWRLGAQAAPVPALLGYAQDPDVAARWHALYSLGRLRVASGVPALLRGLQDQASLVRAIALRGVTRALTDSANFSPRDAAAAIRPLLTDGESQVRINALRALATFRDTALAG